MKKSSKSCLAVPGTEKQLFALSIVEKAVAVVKAYADELGPQDHLQVQGSGELDDPYVFNNQKSLLSLMLNFDEVNRSSHMAYFRIGGRYVRLNKKNNYVCDFIGENLAITDDVLKTIVGRTGNETLSTGVVEDRIKYAFLCNLFTVDELKNYVRKAKNPRTKINDLIYALHHIHSPVSTETLKITATVLSDGESPYIEVAREKNIQPVSEEGWTPVRDGGGVVNTWKKTTRIACPEFLNQAVLNRVIANLSVDEKAGRFLGAYSLKDGKGPSYPEVHDKMNLLLDYIFIWDELGGKIHSPAVINMSICSSVRNIIAGDLGYIGSHPTESPPSFACEIPSPDGGNSIKIRFGHRLIQDSVFQDTLPVIIGCFFIAETARNPTTYLSNMLLIDLIEIYNMPVFLRGVKGRPDLQSGYPSQPDAKYFSWQYMVGPDEEELHPMAHDGSFKDEFGAKENLEHNKWNINSPPSKTRNKEADLLIRWLQFEFKQPSVAKKLENIQKVPEDEQEAVVLDLIGDLLAARLRYTGSMVYLARESPPQHAPDRNFTSAEASLSTCLIDWGVLAKALEEYHGSDKVVKPFFKA